MVEEPTLEVEPEAEPEEEISAAAEPPETEAAGDELAPDFFEDRPPGEEPETAKVAPEGGDEEEDTWGTYLKPENVLGDDLLTVEAEISAEGETPSVAVELDDLERAVTTEMDSGEPEPVPVEPEPAAEPEIEPTTQPEQPEVPADEEPPGLSIAARLAQLRVELSAKYAPEESSPPAAPKAESKPEAEESPPSPEMQGEEVGGDTEADSVAEVEAEMETAGVALEEEVSPSGTAAEAGKPPTDKPLPIADRLSRLRKEIAQDETHEQVAGPEPEAEMAAEMEAAEEATEPTTEPSSGPTDTTAAMFVDPKLATFTLVDIYKVQGLYQQALQALDILENKGGDPERIERERTTISAAMSTGSKSE